MPKLVGLGDTHGHHTELMALFQKLLDSGFDPEHDTLVGLGDYCDGGPDSKAVIDQLMAWERQYPHWVFLKGNHCQMMLDALAMRHNPSIWNHWWGQGGKATAMSYLPKDASDYERALMQPENYIDPKHLDWLRRRPLMFDHPSFYFVHAGFRPRIPIEQQSAEDMTWIREDFFNLRFDFGKPVIFGHTPMPEPRVFRALVSPEPVKPIVAVGIDTMIGDYGKLTAVELDPDQPQAEPIFHQVDAVAGPWSAFKGFGR